MRAIVCRQNTDDLGELQLEEVEAPALGADQVRVQMRAASVNFPDLLMVAGKYQAKPPLPFTPGMEGTGDIVEIGVEVSDFQVGDRVIASTGVGSFADEVAVAARQVRPLADNVTYEAGAAYTAAYLTALVGLQIRGSLQPGEALLVHGSAGGVGLAAVEMGKMFGAKVIATGSSDEKLGVVKEIGADHVLNVKEGFRQQVKDLTGGRGADVIYDPVGGDVFDESIRCIAPEGRLLVVGFASGRIPSLAANMPLIKMFSVIGVRAGEYGRHNPEKGMENVRTIDQWVVEGKLKPHICKTFPLERTVDAMKMLRDRQAVGRVVVTMAAD